jgi:hypothetical protein
MGAPVRTDLDGRFEETGLEPGTYRVTAYRRGGGTATVNDVALGDDVELRMSAVARLSGTVIDAAGKPVEGFLIAAVGDDDDITTRGYPAAGTAGAWEIGGLEPGGYVVYAGTETSDAYLPVTVGPGEHRDGIELRLAASAAVTGRLLRKDGSPIQVPRMGVVLVSDPDGTDIASQGGSIDDTGRFTLRPVPAAPIIVRYYLEPAPGEEPVAHTLTTCTPEAGKTLDLGTFHVGD